MADVFISYSSQDRDRVKFLADAIEIRGWSVSWDLKLEPGTEWPSRLQEDLENASCVVVVWSRSSIESKYVLAEAGAAMSRNILLPVMIEPLSLPQPFAKILAVELYDWKGGPHPGIDNMLAAIEKIIGESAPAARASKRKTTRKKADKQKHDRDAGPEDDQPPIEKSTIESATDSIVARAQHDFTVFLNNKEKKRKKGFIVLVHGGPELTPLEQACFDQNQTWNRCLTSRYTLKGSVDSGALLALFKAFLDDLRKLMEGENASGRMRPDEGSHLEYADRVIEKMSTADSILDQTKQALHILDNLIKKGLRLVLFGEFSDLGNATSLNDLGITEEVLKLLADFPERMGIVLSGMPDAIVTPNPEPPPSLAIPFPEIGPPLLVLQLESVPIEGINGIDTHAQAFTNYIPRGPDRLRIVHEVNAIAETIALKKMKPPLVVGILGGWGWGKSFVLHLLEERLRDIRCESITPGENSNEQEKEGDDQFPYVGHIYLIRFDAWTYSKSSLWSSLMQTILLEFNRQLGIEQTTREYGDDEPQVWRLLMELGHRQVQEIRESPLRKKAIDAAISFREGNQEIEELWNRFENLRQNERIKLKKSEAELAAKRSELEQAKADLEDLVDDDLEKKVKQNAWRPIWEELLTLVKGEVDEKLKNEGVENPSLETVKGILGFRKRIGLGLNLQTALFAAFAVVSGIVPLILKWDAVGKYTGGVVAILSAFGGALQVVHKSQKWLENKFEEYQSHASALRDRMEEQRDAIRERILAEQVEAYRNSVLPKPPAAVTAAPPAIAVQNGADNAPSPPPTPVTELEQSVRAVEAEVAEYRRNVGFTANYTSLLDFVKGRIDSGFYDEKLGLLHQVQKDLQDLTDAVLAEQNGKDHLFPRGRPRIVLVVDDLDRCPPQRVVEVLEAAQLLVKTRLFVIVMALDVRYITRALEKEYRHVLIRNGEPSGLDYIEKIIQVPYRVRAIQDDAMSDYLRPQMEIVNRLKPTPTEPKFLGQDGTIPPVRKVESDRTEQEPENGESVPGPSESENDPDTVVPEEVQTVPRTIVKFLEHEPELLADCCNKVIVSPRATKRLINVFKLLKIIWNRRDLGHGPPDGVKRVMLMLLTLSTRHSEVLRVLLQDLEDECRRGPHWAKQISNFLIKRCNEEKKESIHSGEWERVRELISDESVFPRKVKFKDVGVENIRLIVSFSFVGETDPEREQSLHRAAYNGGLT